VITDPRAKHVFFELWAYVPIRVGNSYRSCRGACDTHAIAQTGQGSTVDIGADGRFTYVAPPKRFSFLSMIVTDARFVTIGRGVFEGTRVPDEQFWKLAKREAARG
jgi:hypothetical protein